MDLPFCKICGQRHRLGGCPKFQDPATTRREWLRAMLPKPREIADAAEIAGAAKVEQHHQAQEAKEEAPPQGKPKFDKVAYQRELMRKRRAKAKSNGANPDHRHDPQGVETAGQPKSEADGGQRR